MKKASISRGSQKSDLTFADLQREIQELGERFPKFKTDDLFVLWFLRAYITATEESAAEAITGGARDKGVDALFIDDASHSVFVVQAKYRQNLSGSSEQRSDVITFIELAHFLNDWTPEECSKFLAKTEPSLATRLLQARKLVHEKKYDTWLYFVTTGNVSESVRTDAKQKVSKCGGKSKLEIIDGKRAMLLFRDYLDGVAPPIPSADLEMESGSTVTVNGIAQRFDRNAQVESWVFSMQGQSIAEIYDRAGLRIFARNIRGFMGKNTPVNQGMIETLESEPEKFFYYNNGVTIVCDHAERKSAQGRDFLYVANPQIINGQQTTRTLAAHPHLASKASVLVKVIVVPRQTNEKGLDFEELVSRIVAGTNWQNAITQSDLMSNDRRQIEIERAFRKVGYCYLRKRQSKGETKSMIGKGQYRFISKEEVAQAVAGCELDPLIIRSGREKLFSEHLYPSVFPNSDPNYFLPRYWLMREVSYCSKGVPERGYAKWLVLNFVWSYLAPIVKGNSKARNFRLMCEQQDESCVVPLNQVIDRVFNESLKFYRLSRGTGASAQDVSTFFKSKKGLPNSFREHWKALGSPKLAGFEKLLEKVKESIVAFDE